MPFYLPLWSIQPPSGAFVGASNQMLYAWSALYGAADPAPAKYDAEIWVGGVLITTVKGIQSRGQGTDIFPGVNYKQYGIDIGPSIVAANIGSPDYSRQADGGLPYTNIWADCLKEVYVVLIAYVEGANGFVVPQPYIDLKSDSCFAVKGAVGPYDRNLAYSSGYDAANWITTGIADSLFTEAGMPLSNKPLLANTAYNSLEQLSFIRKGGYTLYLAVVYAQTDGTAGGALIELPIWSGPPTQYLQISVGPETLFLNGALYSGTLPTGPLDNYYFWLTPDGSALGSQIFVRNVFKSATTEALFMNEYGAWDSFVFTAGLNQSDVNSSNELYRIPATGIYSSGFGAMRMQQGRELATVRSDQRYMIECDLRSFESAWLTELQRTSKLCLNDLTVNGGWHEGGAYGWPTPVTRDNAEQVRKQANKDVTRFRLSGTYAMTLPTIEL